MRFFTRRNKGPKLYPTHMIVGLGNPGAEYRGTRHNVGFEVVDALAELHGVQIRNTKNQSLCVEVQIAGVDCLLVKPMTFMNLSGRSVAAHAKQHGIKPENILIIADELDLPTGKVKMKPKGGAGGHNGHKSVIQSLGSQEYPRIKIGIGKSGETVDHVLSRFKPEEKPQIQDAIRISVEGCELWVSEGVARAMNSVNTD